ncbi:MAG: 3'-5' exonuclease, partial [Methanoregula sp.]
MPAQVMRSSETLTVSRTFEESGALTIAINQVEYSNTPEGPIIHIFGRDPGGLAHRIDVTGFLPYFYVPEEQVGQTHPDQVSVEPDTIYRSIRGEKLKRLYTVRPGDVRNMRERYRHFEADIPFATRFMIDCGLTGAVSVPATTADYHELVPAEVDAPARVCMIDIECEDERGFPDTQRDAIICITCHDSFDNDYTTFLFSGGTIPAGISEKEMAGGFANGCFRKGAHTICSYADEVSMLRAFGAYITSRDPDILSGWNFVEFDMPYIMGRMEKLGLSPVMLARLPGMTERNALRGRALFDLLTGYKKMHSTQKESYRLDAIAQEEVGESKVRYTGTVSDLWKKQPALLVEYNYKDVELCVAINKKDNIVGFYREIARYVGCPLDKTLNSSSVIDVYILRKAHGKYVL